MPLWIDLYKIKAETWNKTGLFLLINCGSKNLLSASPRLLSLFPDSTQQLPTENILSVSEKRSVS